MDFKDKIAVVYDYGLFPEVAARLARDFGTVYYYVSWEEAFPKMNRALIGTDFKGIVRIMNFEDYVDQADIIVFPDTHCASKVEYYRSHGYNVAGAGYGEEVELNRIKTRNIQERLGLPTQKTLVAYGISDLKNILEDTKDKYVKLNIFRGDIESFLHTDYESSLPILNHLQYDLGAKGDHVEFTVEDKVDGAEPGLDAIIANGKVLSPTMFGYEVRGAGYIGKVLPYDRVPIQLKMVQDKINTVLQAYEYRFFYSSEIKVPNKTEGYLIDPCCRLAAPAVSAIQTELIDNYSDVMWGLATGAIVDPIIKYKYCAGIVMYSDWAQTNWLKVNVPKQLEQWFKFRWITVFDGEYWIAPGSSTVGTAIALGNSVDEVFKTASKRAEQIKGYQLGGGKADLEAVLEAIKEGEKYGISF